MNTNKRFKKLSHSLWECKYHIVFCPKYRYRIFKNEIRQYTTNEFYRLTKQRDQTEVVEINVREDHVHLILEIPPKYSISEMVGFLKGKIASKLFYRFPTFGKTYWGRHLWARGYCVSTIGLNEDQIRTYVRWQELRERQEETHQLGLSF
jgi:putative transposase